MENLIVPIAVAFVAAAIPGFWALWQARDKGKLDERARYYADIRADVDELRERLDAMEGYIVILEDHINVLRTLMKEKGIEPPPRPSRPKWK